MVDKLDNIRSRHKREQEEIQRQFAEEYGKRIKSTLKYSNVNIEEMDSICQLISEYKNELAAIGIET